MTIKNNLLDTLDKVTYFLTTKGKIQLDREASVGGKIYLTVGNCEVSFDKGIDSNGTFYPSRFNCTCTRHSTRSGSDIPCSHVIAGLIKLREVYSDKKMVIKYCGD